MTRSEGTMLVLLVLLVALTAVTVFGVEVHQLVAHLGAALDNIQAAGQ